MAIKTVTQNSYVISYLGLRKAVGIIGMALPFVLAFGNMFFVGFGIRSSISSYYYTAVGDVFVGSLCAIAVFMMSYRGYDRKDDIAGDLTGIFAIGVALFPTAPEIDVSPQAKIIGVLHLVFAACFFLTLAYFCLALFRKSALKKEDLQRRKRQRNAIYSICGTTIIACLVTIVILFLFLSDDASIKQLDPVFWLEATAIAAFGLSWLTKGEAILKDEIN